MDIHGPWVPLPFQSPVNHRNPHLIEEAEASSKITPRNRKIHGVLDACWDSCMCIYIYIYIHIHYMNDYIYIYIYKYIYIHILIISIEIYCWYMFIWPLHPTPSESWISRAVNLMFSPWYDPPFARLGRSYFHHKASRLLWRWLKSGLYS